jgi:cysteinyl-tRNA synthetase
MNTKKEVNMIELKLTNTLSGSKELFKPIEASKVKLYVCGITPYDYSHIGHGRSYVNFDLLVRALTFFGYEVTYVRNVTDIDDKLLNKAIAQGNIADYLSIAQKFTDDFHLQLNKLNCMQPTHEPRATQSIPMIVEIIEQLVKRGHAYVSQHDVYFDISTFPAYGALSGKKLDEMQAGARVEINDKKRNPADFVLWKGNDHGAFWDSPWGKGRPGWHIECSAMIKEVLGDTIDIHAGGHDLIFPHHENEIAQSECATSKKLANIWMHNGFLNINKEKMSKSLGNMLSLGSILHEVDPMVLRFYFLQHHYHAPMDYSLEGLQSTRAAYKRLINALSGHSQSPQSITSTSFDRHNLPAWFNDLVTALADDLNSPKMLGIIFEHLAEIRDNAPLRQSVYELLFHGMGLSCTALAEEEVTVTPEITQLIAAREAARAEKNWKLADELRDRLTQLGYVAQDQKLK